MLFLHDMDLTLLRSFLAVAETGAITEAAERIGITQPALSRRLQQLEDHLGVALLARGRKGATLTEIGSLVAALNRFMGRLDRQIGVMRNLIADASHQLRTPIAALRAQAELAFDEPDPDRLRRIVGRIHARSLTLSRLTDQLLNHALIIHRADSEPLQPVDLRTGLEATVAWFRTLAPAVGVEDA